MAVVKNTLKKITPRIDQRKIKNLGVLGYDIDNHYPQRVIDIVNDSGTATTALKTFTKFVSGAGTKNEDFGKVKINKNGLTVNRLIRKIAESKGKFNGVALHFNYNGLGQKTEVNFIPFEYNRLTLEEGDYPDRVAIYDDWNNRKNKNIKKDKVEYIHKYNPKEVLDQVQQEEGEKDVDKWESFKGQVWYYTPNGGYPLAPFDSVLEDMQTEAQTKRFKNSTATNNFLASHIVITGKEEDEEGNPLAEGEGIGATLSEFTGGDGAAGLIHIEKEFEDEFFQLEKLDHQDYDGLYQFTEESSRDSILRNFLIPPTLLIQTAGKLGTSREIADAASYYNDITEDDRKMIAEILKEAFTGFVFDVNPSGDYSIKPLEYNKPIDQVYLPYYSKDEIRIANGDEATIKEEGEEEESETILAIELGVGGTTALVSIVSNPELSIDQKKGTLKVLFGFSDEKVNEVLGIETNPNAQ